MRNSSAAISKENVFLSSKTTSEVWHNRLGHPNFQVISTLSSNKCLEIASTLNKNFICVACQLGKSKKLPFSLSTRCSPHPLFLVHCDVWGAAPVPSISGYHYYIVFIDDFSRFIWLYPMKVKSDSVTCFLHFKKMVENLFSTKIKYFQSDGAMELIKGRFKLVLDDCGIVPRTSCPHTQQQNGIAERKHRHITELGLSLMFHCSMPKQYWLEASFSEISYVRDLITDISTWQSPCSV